MFNAAAGNRSEDGNSHESGICMCVTFFSVTIKIQTFVGSCVAAVGGTFELAFEKFIRKLELCNALDSLLAIELLPQIRQEDWDCNADGTKDQEQDGSSEGLCIWELHKREGVDTLFMFVRSLLRQQSLLASFHPGLSQKKANRAHHEEKKKSYVTSADKKPDFCRLLLT